MMNCRKALFFLPLLMAAGCLTAGQFAAIGRTAAAPSIDGKADEVCYRNTLPITGLTVAGTLHPADAQTELRMVYDDQNLYGVVTANRNGGAALPSQSPSRNDPNIWRGDSVELFFAGQDQALRHFMIDHAGSVCAVVHTRNGSGAWISEVNSASRITAAAERTADGWRVEFAIPRTELPEGEPGFNLIRNHGANLHSSWARLEEVNWRNPEKYGRLAWLESVPGMRLVNLPELKLNSCLKLALHTAEPLKFELTAAGKTQKLFSAEPAVEFRYAVPPRKQSVRLAVFRGDGGQLYDYTLALPEGRLGLVPENVKNNLLLLAAGSNFPGRIAWRSSHNLPGGDRKSGDRVRIDYSLIFEVPEGVAPLKGEKIGERTADGRKILTFEQKERFAYNAPHWINSAFRSTLPAGATGVIRYKVQWADGVQPFRDIPFKVINIPAAPRPKKFLSGFYNCWVGKIDDAAALSQIGVNTFAVRGYDDAAVQLARRLKEAGFFVKRGEYFWPGDTRSGGGRGFQDWTKDDRQARARDIGGFYISNGSHFQLSPTYRGKFYDEAVAKEIEFCKKAGINYFAFDMEDYIQPKGASADFSARTLEQFQRFWTSRHPDQKYIDPKVFERNPVQYPLYHTAWVDFKCEVWADFFAEMKKRFAAGLGDDCQSSPYPGVLFTEWSFNNPWSEEGRSKCMRGRRFFEIFNIIEISIYTSVDRGVRQMADTLAKLEKTFPGLKVGLIVTPSPRALLDNYYRSTAPDYPERFKYILMESFAFGCKGVMPWHFNLADLDTFRQFGEGMNILSKIEDIVLNGTYRPLKTDMPAISVTDYFYGKKATWRDQERVFAKSLQHQDKTLITVSEYLTKDRLDVRVFYAPGRKVALKDVETGETVTVMNPEDKDFRIVIEPNRRCRMLLAEPVK